MFYMYYLYHIKFLEKKARLKLNKIKKAHKITIITNFMILRIQKHA